VAFGIYDEAQRSELAVLVAETKLTSQADRSALAAQLAQRLSAHAGLEVDEVVLVPPRTIPKTSSGKRQRAVTRELYLKHALAPPKTGRLGLALVYARSGAGLFSLLRKRLKHRREPD
jgi:acyl-CoA synthetase (AMP-forming)/AMP-acid ligase II